SGRLLVVARTSACLSRPSQNAAKPSPPCKRPSKRSCEVFNKWPRGIPAASGASLMQERTAFRLAMLENGYWPLLNDCKRPIEKNWQRKRPDRSEVLSWDRSAFASTGMKIDGDLAVIDADIREPALIDALAEAPGKRHPELFTRGLVRHAGEVKEAWFARTETPFRR